jgi:hypothetical protein
LLAKRKAAVDALVAPLWLAAVNRQRDAQQARQDRLVAELFGAGGETLSELARACALVRDIGTLTAAPAVNLEAIPAAAEEAVADAAESSAEDADEEAAAVESV